ncbi:MAG TPA: enoyl-CoA hydratase/isomerase family protein [Thermoanaerobaculia bacterium]|nr:enoyl-CoA hydratase/isomerase family protein [Thermoanaerobaculia bacterium]
MSDPVLLDRLDRVALLTIDRADKLNALDEQVGASTLRILAELEDDAGIGCLVVTGAGDRAFVAGADIQEFEGRSPLEQRGAMRFPRIFDVMASFASR